MASDEPLLQAARILARTLAQKAPLQNLEAQSDSKTEALYQRLLESYAEELEEASPSDQRLWILRRLASIESRLMTLQASAAGLVANTAKRPLEPEDVFAISRSQKTFPALLSLPMDDSIVQNGFYPTERLASGETFRWIGPQPRARLFLPRIEEQILVTLAVLYAYAELDKVKVSMDEGPWVSGKIERAGSLTLLHFEPISGAKRYLQTVQLDIDAVRCVVPKQDGKPDMRMLCIALSKVEVRPLR